MEDGEEKLNAAGFAAARRSSGRQASKPPAAAAPSKRRKVGEGDDADEGGREQQQKPERAGRPRGRPPSRATAAAATAAASSPANRKQAAARRTKKTKKRKTGTKRYGGTTSSSSEEEEEESEVSSDDDDLDALIAPVAGRRRAAARGRARGGGGDDDFDDEDEDEDDDDDYDDERADPTVAGIFSGELESEEDSEEEEERGRGRGGGGRGRGVSWTGGAAAAARRTPSPDGEDAPFPDYAPPSTTAEKAAGGRRRSSAGGANAAAAGGNNETGQNNSNVPAFAPDPAALRVRPFSTLPRAAGELPPALIPADALADAVASYLILRAFSWQLRLSPFSLADWCAALAARNRPTQLLDEAAVCLLRALAWDETVQDRRKARRRRLPIALLDAVTWPEFVCDSLRKAGQFRLAGRVEGGGGGDGGGLAVVEQEEEEAPAAAAAPAVVDAPAPPAPAPAAPAAAAANGDTTMAEAAAVPPPAPADASFAAEDAVATADALLRRSTRERAPPPLLYQPTLPGAASAPNAAAAPAPPPGASAATVAAAAAKAASLLPRRRNARLSSHPLHAALSAGPQLARRSPQGQRPEFFSLPASTKAAVFSALADALLETRAVRSELDLRETEGWFVSGARGGAGGSGQMWSSVAERDDAVARGEGNYDACVLCGYGGSLLCCDACPGAYHFKCLGIQPNKLKDDEDWICPECEIGGRGESAGLRVPCAGVDRETGLASWVAHCALLRGARPPRAGTGAEAAEGSAEGLPMEALVGEEAKAAWRASEEASAPRGGGGDGDGYGGDDEIPKVPSRFASTAIVRQRGSERPHESTLELIARGEQQPALHDASTTGAAETYKNRYGNGWAAAAVVYRAAYDECARRRGRPTAGLPPELTFSEQAEPMPLVKFAWPASQGKGLVLAGVAKCGRCETCTNPNQRKACLAPVLVDGGGGASGAEGRGGAARGGAAPAAAANGSPSEAFPAPPPLLNVKLQALINFTLKLERDVSPLLEGPWGGGGGRGGGGGGADDDDFGRAEFRRAWAARLREASGVGTVAAALLQIEGAARRALRSGPWRPPPPVRSIPGKPYAEPPRAARAPGGWMVDATGWRRDWAPGRLPASLVRRAARRGTNLRIPQVDYYTSPIVTPPHLAWRRDVAAARSTAALAVQARVLADALLLQFLRRPDEKKGGPPSAVAGSSASAAAAVIEAVAGDAVKAAAAAAAARRRNAARRKAAGGGGGAAGAAGGSDGDDDGEALGSRLADIWSRTRLRERRGPCPLDSRGEFSAPTFEYLVELPDDAPAEGCTGAAAAAAAAAAAGGGIKVEGGNFVVAGGGNPAGSGGGGLYGAVAAACADGSLQIDGAAAAEAPHVSSAPPHAAGALPPAPPSSAPAALAVATAASAACAAAAPSATVAALARYRAALAAAAADEGTADERGVYVSVKIAALGRSGNAGVSVEVEVLTARTRAAQRAYDLARAEVLRASGIREEVVRAAALGKDPVALAKHLAALTVHGYTPAGGVGSGFLRAGSAGGGNASGGGATTDTGDDDGGDNEDDGDEDADDAAAARDGSRPRSSSRAPAVAPAPPPAGRVSTKPYRTAEERRRLAASASTASRRRRLAAEEVLAALAAAQLPPPPTGFRMRGRVKQAARWAALPMRELSSRATRTRAPGLAPEAAAIAARGMLNPNQSRAIEGIAAAAAATRAEEDRQALRKKRAAQVAAAAAKRAAGGSRALAAAVARQREQRRGPGRPRLDESEKKRRLELRRLSVGGVGAGGSSGGGSVEGSPAPGGSDVELGEEGGDGGDNNNDSDNNNTLAVANAAAKAAAANFLAIEKELEAAEEQLYDPKTQLPYLPAKKLSWVHEDRIPIWLLREFEEESRGGPLKGTWKPAPSMKRKKKNKKGKKTGGGGKRGAFGGTSSEGEEEDSDDDEDEEEDDDGLCAACGEGEKLPGEDDAYLTKREEGRGGEGGGDEGNAAAAAAAGQNPDDEPEATTAWIGCEGECGKWFHARCANVTPEQYRALNDAAAAGPAADGGGGGGSGNGTSSASWVCPPCTKKQAAKDARRLAKEASRSGTSDADRQRAAREAAARRAAAEAAGRAAREMGKQAKLAMREHRAAEKTREKEQRAGAKAAAAAEKHARKEAEREARREEKRRRSSAGGGGGWGSAAAAKRAKKAVDLVCVCRGPEVEGDLRGFVQCEGGCSQWFHPVCVGESMAEIEAKGEDFKWSCPGCVGRGELLAAEERSAGAAAAAAAAGGSSPPPSFHAFLPPLTPQAALAAKQVVDAVASTRDGLPFSEPVPLDGSVFQYKELISRPMDLGTISEKLAWSAAAGAASGSSASALGPYSTLAETLEDVALVWRNCAAYNLEGSAISRQAAAAAEDLRRRWWLLAAPAAAGAGGGGAAAAAGGLLRWHSLEGALVTLPATQAPSAGDYPDGDEGEEEGGGEVAATTTTAEAAVTAAAPLAPPTLPPPVAPAAAAPPLVAPTELQQQHQTAFVAPMELQEQQQTFGAAQPPLPPPALAPAPLPFVPVAVPVASPPPTTTTTPVDDDGERAPFGNADAAAAAAAPAPPPPPPDFLG